MNPKRGLDRFSKLPDDGDPRSSNNYKEAAYKGLVRPVFEYGKVQVGKDQEQAQSAKDSLSRWEKNQTNNQVPIP